MRIRELILRAPAASLSLFTDLLKAGEGCGVKGVGCRVWGQRKNHDCSRKVIKYATRYHCDPHPLANGSTKDLIRSVAPHSYHPTPYTPHPTLCPMLDSFPERT